MGKATAVEPTKVVEVSLAQASQRAYRTDWSRFSAWATENGSPFLPAPPGVVTDYITAAAAEQDCDGSFRYRPASLARWVSSINHVHTVAGLAAPGRSELVRDALAEIRRTRGTPPVRRASLLLDDIGNLLDDIRNLVDGLASVVGDWPAGVAARRDTALLLMASAGTFQRSELVGLTAGDVTLHPEAGMHVRLSASRTGQEAPGRTVTLSYERDPAICPPCAWVRWRELLHAADAAPRDQSRARVMRVLRRQAAHDHAPHPDDRDGEGVGRLHVCRTTGLPDPTESGRALFPSVHGTGIIRDRPMSGDALHEMIRRRAEQAGHTVPEMDRLGGHSRRPGPVTGAFRTGAEARGWAPRTHTTYAADWALFADWCEAGDRRPLPADPTTVLEFVAECPSAPATRRRRVIAIDHHHTAAGHPPPGADPRVRDVVGRPPTEPPPIAPETRARVDAALRMLPSRGWTGGLFGRRDRCLLVLSQLARIPHKHLADLAAADVAVAGGVATVTVGGLTRTVEATDDPVLCGPCAIARWLVTHQVIVTKIATRAIADHLRAVEPVTTESVHACLEPRAADERTLASPLLATADQWGSTPFPLSRMSPHAVSRRARDLLAGIVTPRRVLPEHPAVDEGRTVPVTQEPVVAGHTRERVRVAWDRRRTDLADLADVAEDLAAVDHQVAELNRRVCQLLAMATEPPAG